MAILRQIPPDHKQRLQRLLDEGDLFWFSHNPHERERIRMQFRGEVVEGDGAPSRYVLVTHEGGRLIRRFTDERGVA